MFFQDGDDVGTGERKLRFGCHDFLNSMPITYPLTEGIVECDFEMVFAPPAELSKQLEMELLDAAFIPSIEYARLDGLKIVPGFGIAARGAVKTVVMFSKHEIKDIKTVATDRRSRTSAALLKILFEEHYKQSVEITIDPPDMKNTDPVADAFLLIGDEAFMVGDEDYKRYDLSEAWFSLTGKPFVFALLCVSQGVYAKTLIEKLKAAKDEGLRRIGDICKKAAQERQIPEEVCRDYLTSLIRYNLDEDDIEGLKLFFEYAKKHGIVEQNPELDFYA